MKDSKGNGMNWTDNIYHKIEGIVPEVNDIKIQDTFKYVENHVNTVGGTFKKFCSGVVQDFFPLSADPVKSEAKEVVPEGDVAISTYECKNYEINIVQVSLDAEAKQSPVETDAVACTDKHQDQHHNEERLRNATSTDSHEDPDSTLAVRENNDLIKENLNLSDDVDSIKESEDGQLDDTFKYVEDHVHAVSGAFKKFCSDVVQDFFPLSVDPVKCEVKATPEDAAIGTDGYNKSVISMVEVSSDAVVKQSPMATDAIDPSEGQLGHESTEHDENVGDFKNAMSMNSHGNSDSILASGKINVLTNESSNLGNGVDSIKDSADEQLELNSHGVADSLEASSLDIIADDAERDFGASSALSGTACSVVSGEDTITGTGLVFSDSYISRDSTITIGCSSDISSPEECASDSRKRLLSSTAASTMSTDDGAIEKQLVSSYSHLSLESNGDSSTVIADTGMETIDLCDEAKLGESCVFLDDSVLYDVSRRARKLGSYKKKIQDIFALKKRLAKEYEQLAIWYGDANMDLSHDAAPFGSRNLQNSQAIDSEWELL